MLAASSKVVEFMSKSKDPRADILKVVGDLKGVRPKWNNVLVATYIRPAMTAGGIIRPDSNVAEDEWQGKVGLVLKMGPMAYRDDEDTQFNGEDVKVGEWAVYLPGDGRNVSVNGYPCRWIKDSSIKMVVDDPSIIF
jgi:co-chaperonin GroES (HSP10)